MILVVFAHVETFMLAMDPGSTLLSSLFLSFRMPLFFFISGYLVYKGNISWTFKEWTQRIQGKIKTQLMPTFVFGIIYTYIFSLGNIRDFLYNYHKFGYWFTICLFGMLLIIYTINLLARYINRNCSKKCVSIALLVISLIFFTLKFVYDKSVSFSAIADFFCFHQVCVYFPFFALGYISSQYKDKFSHFLDNDRMQAIVFILFCIAFYVKYTLDEASFETSLALLAYRSIQDIVIGVFGISIVYNFFRKYQSSFTKERKVGRILQYIGGHTLEIYLLHYFFLKQLPKIVDCGIMNSIGVPLEFAIVTSLSLLVIGCSLLLSRIICTNSITSTILLGRKSL